VRCRVGPLLAVLLLALPFGPLPRVSARSLEDIEGRGAISLCAHPNALPFASRRGPVHGVQIDLADELAKRLGVGLKVEWVTVGFQYRAVDCDIVMDTIVEEDALQERDLRWSTPYQRSGVALALRPGGDAIERFEDLGPEARVGVQLGSLAQWLLGRQGLKTIPFGFEDEMVAALASGEIDAAAATPTSIGWYNHEHPEAKLVIVHAADHEPELAWDLAVGMRRSDRFLRRQVDRIVQAMLDDGTVARIYAAYGIEHRPPVTRKPELVERKSRLGEEGCVRVGNARDCTASR
jgi:polar amino acid transport system substrate-binding protein